jgi:hypothetical protein
MLQSSQKKRSSSMRSTSVTRVLCCDQTRGTLRPFPLARSITILWKKCCATAQFITMPNGTADNTTQYIARAPSLPGITPSTIKKEQARIWSAITLSELLVRSLVFVFARRRADKTLETNQYHSWNARVCNTAAIRSNPMPVSTDGFGNGWSTPLSSTVVLHKYQVPDFNIAITIGLRTARRAAPKTSGP